MKLKKAELIDMIQSQTRQIDEKDIQISLLKKYIFAKKSEKWTPEDKTQGRLFNEIESSASPDNSEETVPASKTDKPERKTGKKPLDASLPREKEVYDVDEDKKLCPCCHKPRPLINEIEGGEKFVFYPARIVVRKRNTKSYGACTCSGFQENEDLPQVITAEAPEEFMPGSIATPSLVAHIITNKFCDGLPFDRQQKIFSRIGVRISKQNMSNWSIKASLKCSDVIEYMRQVIMKGFLINMDETYVQVLHEENREARSKSYMWVMTGGDEHRKAVLFNYSPTRNQSIPLKLLAGFSGCTAQGQPASVLQTDGYAGYNEAVKVYGLIHIGCLTHVRRKFYKLATETKKMGKAHKGLDFCNRIYGLEKRLREENLSPENFLELRRQQAIPIWDEFYEWLKQMKIKGIPEQLGIAINYAFNQYPNLIRYLDYPEVTPDNNIAENAIRPFVIGRKNWLFNNTSRGAHSSAILYSLVETAKINNVEPSEYLNFLFSELPKVNSDTDLESLMPWSMVR